MGRENWRKVTNLHRMGDDMVDFSKAKWQTGIDEHGPFFQGDPVQHAKEEVADLWFYIDKIKAQRDTYAKFLVEFIQAWEKQPAEKTIPSMNTIALQAEYVLDGDGYLS